MHNLKHWKTYCEHVYHKEPAISPYHAGTIDNEFLRLKNRGCQKGLELLIDLSIDTDGLRPTDS